MRESMVANDNDDESMGRKRDGQKAGRERQTR
jgi:hypothetical protein